MQIQPTIAIGDEFLKAYSSVPQNIQKKVYEFLTKFKENPTSKSINYEKIHAASDENLRSVRIDHNYRGILFKPDNGSTYILLWIDKHDNAYKWAKNKKCMIHPETGSLQLLDVSLMGNMSDTENKVEDEKGIFSHLKDRELLKLGVPEIFLESIKKIKDESELEELRDYLPAEAYEGLFLIMAGDSYEKVINEREMKKVENNNFTDALKHSDSKRRFYIIESASDLNNILDYPLEKWRVFLHPMQQNLAQKHFNGPVRVLGEAGTGKTVLAMHRAKYLAEKVFTKEGEKILFTTFTKNLASDIENNLKKICDTETSKRIKVINIDRWIYDFLKEQNYDFKIIFNYKTNIQIKELWDTSILEASEFDEKFLRDEWEQVIQQNGITTWEEYKSVARVGRRKRLSRRDKKKIWNAFEKYRELLSKHSFKEWMDAVRDVRIILESKKISLPFKSVIIDEAQDMNQEIFKLIRKMIPERANDIFITGDAHQRIYKNHVALSKCGIKIVGRSYKLKVNYRTTEEIRNFAVNILEGYDFDDLDGRIDKISKIESLTHGEKPKIVNVGDFQESVEEIKNIIEELQGEKVDIKNICIVARTNQLCEQYIGALKANGIATYKLKSSEAEDRNIGGVRIGTMHRAKGLEFEYMIVIAEEKHLLADKNIDITEKSLFYVACTRAKIGLWIIIGV
jgi:superfamily I DNA and RNA helicase/mRNA-degrading endonuclease RelE of RelBE toxin-antitoxin system